MHLALLGSAFVLVVTLSACGGKGSSAPTSGAVEASVSLSGLSAFEDRLADLLTLERVRAVADTAGSEPQQQVEASGLLKSVSWSWDSERKREMSVSGQTFTLPVSNQVAISQFQRLDRQESGPQLGKSFVETHYRSVSAEEMAAVQARLQEQLQKRVEKGELTAEQAKLAGGMGSGLLGKERVVESIEGIGDACRWVAADNTLAVGHRNVFFALHVDLSAEAAVNRDKAVALAKLILAAAE